MKKLFKLIAILLSIATLTFIGCKPSTNSSTGENNNETQTPTYTFVAPDGAPALSIAKFIADNENFNIDANFSYSVVASSNIGGFMQQGKADFIIMPVNAASKLYKANSADPYKMVSVITHGNLYLMASDGTNTLDGLKGKVVGVIGQGLVPDLTLKAILADNNLLDAVVTGDTPTEGKITLRYFSQATEMIPLLKQGVLNIGLLPEPACTNLTKVASNKTWTRVDVQELYDSEAKAYPQAVLMVKSSVYAKHSQQINAMKEYFDANGVWIKENVESAINSITGALAEGVTPSLVATNINATVIDNCKIYFESASSAKQSVIDYINKIIAINAQSAKAVGNDFFA